MPQQHHQRKDQYSPSETPEESAQDSPLLGQEEQQDNNNIRTIDDPLHKVLELSQQDISQQQLIGKGTPVLIQTLANTIINEENSKKRKREDNPKEDTLSIWDLIPLQFTHVKLQPNELPSIEFCKVLLLYTWAYSKHLQQESESLASPVLTQDDSSSIEPNTKKVAHAETNNKQN